MSVPLPGRNARLFKDGSVICYGKKISVKTSAELIKEYSMDSLTPAIVAPGKQSFKSSAEKLGMGIEPIYIGDVSHTTPLFFRKNCMIN